MNRRRFLGAAAGLGAAALYPRGLAPQGNAWRSWRVNGARVNQRLTDLSRFGRNPQGGVSRVAFGPADIEARAFVTELVRGAGLSVRVDPVGNILGRASPWRRPSDPVGSHIDWVPEGGNYDGDVGSMSAIEVAHTLLTAVTGTATARWWCGG
jgi:N-carbamoyl-L-amino-acid hydrolase